MVEALRSGGRILVYPTLVGAVYLASTQAIARGAAPMGVMAVLGVASILVVAILERLLPYRSDWLRSHGDVLTDLLHFVFSVGLAGDVGRRMALSVSGLGLSLWPAQLPLPLQVLFAILVAEMGVYWLHRWQHSSALGWRIHSIHHAVERLYVLNGSRVHAFDSALTAIVSIVPLALLGIPEETLAVTFAVAGIHSALQHSNIDVRLGPLNSLLSAAEVHRWHHSRSLTEANANYGQILLVWDALFGTFRAAHPGSPSELGLSEGHLPLPTDFLGQTAAPLRARYWRSAEATRP